MGEVVLIEVIWGFKTTSHPPTEVFERAVQRLDSHATPHALWHTAVTEGVHTEGVSIVDVSHIVGHKDLRTTMSYIHSAPERLYQL